MKNKNKIVLFIFILLVIICIINIFNRKGNTTENRNEITVADGLPRLSQVDSDKNPMLFDFLNSSITYKMNNVENIDKIGFYYALLQNKHNKKDIYVEYYNYAESLVYPTIGSKPKALTLNKEQISNIDNFASKMSKNRVFEEGDWVMYLISEYNAGDNQYDYCDNIGRWGGIDMKQFQSNDKGLMYELVNSGFGWPTEWLRKEPYINTMKKQGYDVNDSFWDQYNVGSYKIYKRNIHGTLEDEELKVQVVQLNQFQFKLDDNDVKLNEEQLKLYLQQEGWN